MQPMRRPKEVETQSEHSNQKPAQMLPEILLSGHSKRNGGEQKSSYTLYGQETCPSAHHRRFPFVRIGKNTFPMKDPRTIGSDRTPALHR